MLSSLEARRVTEMVMPGLGSGWQRDLLAALLAAVADVPCVAEVQLIGSAAGRAGVMDVWSDLDVVLGLRPGGGACPVTDAGWLGRFGAVWAMQESGEDGTLTRRVVFADGRRLDLILAPAPVRRSGRVMLLRPPDPVSGAESVTVPAAEQLPEEDPRSVRFMSALAVAKLARSDLLIGAHLVFALLRVCLVQGMRLRDRDTGTSVHRHGAARDALLGRLDALRQHPWTAAGLVGMLEELTGVYDGLTAELDPGYLPDWSGLRALLGVLARGAHRLP